MRKFPTTYAVDHNEELVDEPTFLVSNIEWDVDDEDQHNDLCLPDDYYIPLTELLNDDEHLDDIPEKLSIEELKDRVADYLSDKYGFCIRGFVIN